MKSRFIVLMSLMLLSAYGLVGAQSISLDHTDGLADATHMNTGVPVTFYVRLTGDADAHGGVANGFRVYSPDGANWTTTVGDTTGVLGKAQFDGGFFINPFSVTGSAADTIGFAGFRFFATGMPIGFDDITYTIAIGPVDSIDNGKQICLDSAFYPPSGVWKWAGVDVFPTWDGPHCFTVGAPAQCVVALTSPVGGDTVTVGDAMNITWTNTDCLSCDSVDISYSVDGGSFMPIVAAPNTGSYVWTVPDNPSSNVVVKVCCAGSTDCGQSVPFTIVAPSANIVLAIPDMTADNCDSVCIPITVGSFSGVAGVELHLDYDSTCMTCADIDVGYLAGATVNCGNGAVHIIWDDFANPLTLPDSEVLASVCFTGLSETACPVGFNASSQLVDELGDPLAVTYNDGSLQCPPPACVTTVTTPNGGEAWTVGDTVQIAWTFTDGNPLSTCNCAATVSISFDGGATWQVIDSLVVSNMIMWTVADHPSDSCLIQVCCDGVAPICDVSDGFFSIQSPPSPRIVLAIPDMTADNCDSACIPIMVGNFSGVAGVELHFDYDSTCMTCADIDVGYLAGATVNCGNGAVHIIWDDFANPLTLPDSEVLASVCFTGLSETACPVGFNASSQLVDELGDPLAVDYIDGSLAGSNCGGGGCAAPAVCLDHVTGLNASDQLVAGGSATFYLRVNNNTDEHGGIANGFRVYSPDGATWTSTVGDTIGTLGKAQFDGGFFINSFSIDGLGADTVGFGAFRMFGAGLIPSFDSVAYTIDIGPIGVADAGKHICLDSAFYPPSGVWKWAGIDVFPNWDGPHCFGIISEQQPCSLTVTSPIAGDSLEVASTAIITWESDCGCTFRIESSIDGGASWTLVDSGLTSVNLYQWIVPNTPTDSGLVRVCCEDNSTCGVSGMFTIYEAPPPTVILSIPNMTADNCDSACIPITVGNFSGVAGVELHFDYDSTCMTCADIDVGYLAGATVNCGNGAVHIIWDDFANPLTLPDGEILGSVCFTNLSETACSIGFNATSQLVDELGDPLTVTYNDGSLAGSNCGNCVSPFSFTPTSQSGVFRGQATIEGVPAEAGDYVAAFDEDGNCAGAAEVTINGGLAYIVLPIYGDDDLTPGVDEGMNAGENFMLKIYDCSADAVIDYCGFFDCWQNTNGTPLPGPCGDVSNVYDFETVFADTLSLRAGWNLVSFDILFGADDPASVFASLGACLIYVTDFDGGSHYYDPNGPAFLNTLHNIRPGYGYWVKVCNDIMLAVDGVCTYPCNFSVDLDNGWNLIAYWPQSTVTPAVAFADLINAGKLIYVTGFDGGSQYFDPNGPPFLNTLNQIRNGYGYWVKVNAAWPGFQYEECAVAGVGERSTVSDLSLNRERTGELGPFAYTPTNLSSALTGSVTIDNQAAEEGDLIAAFNEAGICVGAARLFNHNGEAYFSMPIYGDDKTTPTLDGMNSGENYHLMLFDASEGNVIEQGSELSGWMNTNGAPLGEPVGFNFASSARLVGEVPDDYTLSQNYPNPFNPSTTIRFGLPVTSQVELAVYNIVGQKVATLAVGYFQAGLHEVEWRGVDETGAAVASGIYFYRLTTDAYNETKKMLLLK